MVDLYGSVSVQQCLVQCKARYDAIWLPQPFGLLHELISFTYSIVFINQMGAVEAPFEEVPNIFDTGGAKGLLVDMVEKIPKFTITGDESADTSGDGVSCSVCLQVLMWLLSILMIFYLSVIIN